MALKNGVGSGGLTKVWGSVENLIAQRWDCSSHRGGYVVASDVKGRRFYGEIMLRCPQPTSRALCRILQQSRAIFLRGSVMRTAHSPFFISR